MSREEAGAAVQRAMVACMGPGAAGQLAVMADSHLERGPLHSRVTRVTGGTAHVEASEPMLAQELTLRGEALVWSVNERMKGRPGATIVLHAVAVSVGRGGG